MKNQFNMIHMTKNVVIIEVTKITTINRSVRKLYYLINFVLLLGY